MTFVVSAIRAHINIYVVSRFVLGGGGERNQLPQKNNLFFPQFSSYINFTVDSPEIAGLLGRFLDGIGQGGRASTAVGPVWTDDRVEGTLLLAEALNELQLLIRVRPEQTQSEEIFPSNSMHEFANTKPLDLS